jgi:ketosteroid isomerase-like protein
MNLATNPAMKRFLGLCGALLIVTVGVLAYLDVGQRSATTLAPATATAATATPETAANETAANETAAVEREIRGLLEKYYAMARTNDRAALKNFSREITAPEYRYSSENGVTDKEATLRLLESLNVEYLSTAFDDLTVQVYGDAAIAKYRDISEIRIGKQTQKKQMRFTNVWVRRDGKWQIVAEHSTILAPAKLLPRHPRADKLM